MFEKFERQSFKLGNEYRLMKSVRYCYFVSRRLRAERPNFGRKSLFEFLTVNLFVFKIFEYKPN